MILLSTTSSGEHQGSMAWEPSAIGWAGASTATESNSTKKTGATFSVYRTPYLQPYCTSSTRLWRVVGVFRRQRRLVDLQCSVQYAGNLSIRESQ